MRSRIILVLLILILGSCNSLTKEEKQIVGEWDAKWIMKETEGIPASLSLEMDGKLIFTDNHRLKIVGYGYDNCIFFKDTTENELDWTLEDNTIRLSENDSLRMEYEIAEIEENSARFIFVGDITIELEKN